MIIGTVCLFAGSTIPSGYCLCDGSSVSRSTYADLFAVLGTTYGAGDGSTTFNLPDLVGKVAIGASNTHPIGDTGGEENHTLTSTEIPSHTHTIPAHTHEHTITATTPKLTHTITQPAFKYNKPGSKNNRSASSGGARMGTSSSAATRSTNFAMSGHTATDCTMSGSITDCAAFNSDNTGSGSAHSNMQPYITLNFVIYAGV